VVAFSVISLHFGQRVAVSGLLDTLAQATEEAVAALPLYSSPVNVPPPIVNVYVYGLYINSLDLSECAVAYILFT